MSRADARALVDAARGGIRALAAYVPGARPAVAGERACRLASNENPLGMPPSARAALAGLGDVSRYPDNDGRALKRALAARHGCAEDCLLLGNGSSDLLFLVASAYLEPGRSAVFARHAFVLYPLAVRAAGAAARIAEAHPLDHAEPLGHDPETLARCAGDDAAVVFLANPNNPTGTLLSDAQLRALLARLPARTAVVLDEAYAEYREPVPSAARFLDDPRVIVTRTFSKLHGLAGLRIGYAVAHPDVAELLNRARQPFNVNTAAQRAACAALDDAEHAKRSRQCNHDGMQRLLAATRALGLRTLGAHGNFLTIRFGARGGAFLRERGILARAMAEYELPDWLRLTIGSPEEMNQVVEALESWE